MYLGEYWNVAAAVSWVKMLAICQGCPAWWLPAVKAARMWSYQWVLWRAYMRWSKLPKMWVCSPPRSPSSIYPTVSQVRDRQGAKWRFWRVDEKANKHQYVPPKPSLSSAKVPTPHPVYDTRNAPIHLPIHPSYLLLSLIPPQSNSNHSRRFV